MRCILLNKDISLDEISSRQKYFYDLFKIYTIPFYNDGIVELKSLPLNIYDVVFLIGHNDLVNKYLIKNTPSERNVALISCYVGVVTKIKYDDKMLFHTDENTKLLDGTQYGFSYGISNAELNLYNCNKNTLDEKLNFCFERVM